MVRKGQLSDESTSNSRRGSSYRGRGRGRGRGRYQKNYHRDQTYNDHSEHQRSKQDDQARYISEDPNSLDYEDTTGGLLEDRVNMEDLYDDRPVQETGLDAINEGRSLQDRIPGPGERNDDHYPGNDINAEVMGNKVMVQLPAFDGYSLTCFQDDAARFEQPSYDEDYAPEGSRDALFRSTSGSGRDDGNGTRESGMSSKDPEELRQKVLESLAEKKKKAAEFMNMEKEGASIHKDQPNDSKVSVNNAGQGNNGEKGNPERDAAVDALLATFGGKEENGPPADTAGSRKNSDTDLTSAPSHISPGTSDMQQLKQEQYKYDDGQGRPSSRGERHRAPRRPSDYGFRDDQDRYRDGPAHGGSRNPSLASSRPDQRMEVRKPEYDEKDKRTGSARQDPRYRYDRYEDASYPKDHNPRSGPGSASGRKSEARYPAAEERRDPRYDEYYRAPEVARVDHPKDVYAAAAMKPPRYPTEPGLQDVEYTAISRDYPTHPPAPGRYAAPREDPRYAQAVPRPPEADYAALYYRDLTEWLDITGYHDYSYRQMHLQRHREARALEESSRYALEHDPAYVPRGPREEADPRRPRGTSMYSMPPPPIAPSAWDEREATKRGIHAGAPVRPAYALPEERDRGGYRAEDIQGNPGGLKRRPRDDEFGEPPHSAKSARHNYDNSHHNAPSQYAPDNGLMRSVQGDDPSDETEAVRLALSRRIASARDRDASPGASVERARRRSLSPQRPPFDNQIRDFSKGYGSPGPSPRFEKEPYGRGRGTKFIPREDFRKPFRPRRGSLGEPSSPHERKPFGRGRGRGFSKDFPPYDRNDHYDSRNTTNDHLMEVDRVPGFPGGELHSHT